MVRYFICLSLIILIIQCSCSDRYSGFADLQLVYPPDQSPLDGASTIAITVYSREEIIKQQESPVEARAGSLSGMPTGVPLRVVAEAKNAAGEIISRGRTSEFSIEEGKRKTLNVFFSNKGSFARLQNDMSRRERFGVSFITEDSLLVTGGVDAAGKILNLSEIYSHNDIRFRQTGALTSGRAWHDQVRTGDGRVIVLGGRGTNGILSSIESYDPGKGRFTKIAYLSIARERAKAMLLSDGNILVCGGIGATSALNSCEIYNLSANTVELLQNRMKAFRYGHAELPLPDGNILLAGGNNLNTIEILDPASGAYQITDAMSGLREDFYAAFLDQENVLFACGPQEAGADILNLKNLRISAPATAPLLNKNCSARIMPDGKIFVAGGMENGSASDLATIINPATWQVEWTGRMLSKRETPAISLLPDGTLLIFGGTETTPFAEIFNPP